MSDTGVDEPGEPPVSDPGTIEVVAEGGCTLVTLHNPEAVNALTPGMIPALTEAIERAARDRATRAIILTGTGDRAFCAGIDVKSVARRDAGGAAPGVDPIVASFEHLHHDLSNIIRAIHRAQVPVIAAVNGHAIGAGFAIAAACDLRLASERATFADGFIARGISGCELGLSYFLPAIVGAAAAFELMLTGRRIDQQTAAGLGLVRAVGADEDLIVSAKELADEIAANAPFAVAMTKEVMWANRHAGSLDQALALESRTQALARNTADAAEARLAFLEKRPPRFGQPSAD